MGNFNSPNGGITGDGCQVVAGHGSPVSPGGSLTQLNNPSDVDTREVATGLSSAGGNYIHMVADTGNHRIIEFQSTDVFMTWA